MILLLIVIALALVFDRNLCRSKRSHNCEYNSATKSNQRVGKWLATNGSTTKRPIRNRNFSGRRFEPSVVSSRGDRVSGTISGVKFWDKLMRLSVGQHAGSKDVTVVRGLRKLRLKVGGQKNKL
ncbi:unnamed protein product [Nesidiocoris tenuis]|uniref:Secreted protein n=1 Tax=Nesidiocoris tenuis TaxID=355587 RepID=A0A6H5HJ94_9HEMI|nr:unnamed protein product [Nesidiocoris tenuis]